MAFLPNRFYLRMSSKMVDDLTTASAPFYQFYVRNQNGFFENSGWQTSSFFEYFIGGVEELCNLINPDNPSDDIYSMLEWEFSIRVMDENGNISDYSEWKSIDMTIVDDLQCEGVLEIIPVYILLSACSSDTAPYNGVCENALDTLNHHLSLIQQTSQWLYEDPDGDYDRESVVYIAEDDLAAIGKSPPFHLSYNGMCYFVPSDYGAYRTNYPVEGSTVLSLDPDMCAEPPEHFNPSCDFDCQGECGELFDNPSAVCFDEFIDDDLTVNLTQSTISHFRMNDNTSNTEVFDSYYWNNGVSFNNTEDMYANPSVSVEGSSLYFNGIDDWVDCLPRADVVDNNDPVENWETAYNPSLFTDPSDWNPSVPPDEEDPPDDPSAAQPDFIDYIGNTTPDNPSTYSPYNPSAAIPEEIINYPYDNRYYTDSDYSYALWFKVDAAHSGITNIVNDGLYTGWELQWDSGTLNLLDNANPSVPVASATSLSNDTWYHVVITFDNSNPSVGQAGSIYINGSIVDTYANASFLDTDTNFMMGIDYISQIYFTGWIDDVRIMKDKVLSTYEVETIYNSGDGTEKTYFEFTYNEYYNCNNIEGENLTNTDEYNNCLANCLNDCETISTCWDAAYNPSVPTDNPSAYDEVFFYDDCEECWIFTGNTGWNCEITSMSAIPLLADDKDEYIFHSKDSYDWTQQFEIDASYCDQFIDRCENLYTFEVYLIIDFRVLSGEVYFGINGFNYLVRPNNPLTLRNRTYNLNFWYIISQAYRNGYRADVIGADINNFGWKLPANYKSDELSPYLSVTRATDDAEFILRVKAKCEVICVDELDKRRVFPAYTCECSDTPEEDKNVYIVDYAMKEAVFKDINGICWHADGTLPDRSKGSYAYRIGQTEGSIITSLTNQYTGDAPCWECVNEDWVGGRTVYYLYDEGDIQNIKNDLDGAYLLMNDITMTQNLDPIGFDTGINAFSGRFDGQGYVIGSVNMDMPGNDFYNGFFGVFDGECKNLGLKTNVKVNGSTQASHSGCMVGEAVFGKFSNCWVEGNITVTSNSSCLRNGGFAGSTTACIFVDCWWEGTYTATSGFLGGGAGSSTESGGFCGYITGAASFERCYAKGSMNFNSNASGSKTVNRIGGFIGNENSGTAYYLDCYARVDINVSSNHTDTQWLGQFKSFLKESDKADRLQRCWGSGSIDRVNADANSIGGFHGFYTTANSFIDCYYNSDVSLSDNPTQDVFPLTSQEMKSLSNFNNFSNKIWRESPQGGYIGLRKNHSEFIQRICSAE